MLGYFRKSTVAFKQEKTSKLIGLLIADIDNMYFHHLTRGVEDFLAKSGHSLILCNTDEDFTKEAEYVKILLNGSVEGIILCPASEKIPWYRDLQLLGIPVVIIDREIEDIKYNDYVGVNNREASCRSVEYLIGLGHTRIAIVVAISGLVSFNQRLLGYEDALREHGIAYDPTLVLRPTERTIPAAEKAVEGLLRGDSPPTAIFCTNNLMTLGTLIAAKKNNVGIPERLSVVGLDDFDWSYALNPPITAVSQPTYTIGATAAQLLIRRIEQGNSTPIQKIIINVELNQRDSCQEPFPETTFERG